MRRFPYRIWPVSRCTVLFSSVPLRRALSGSHHSWEKIMHSSSDLNIVFSNSPTAHQKVTRIQNWWRLNEWFTWREPMRVPQSLMCSHQGQISEDFSMTFATTQYLPCRPQPWWWPWGRHPSTFWGPPHWSPVVKLNYDQVCFRFSFHNHLDKDEEVFETAFLEEAWNWFEM